jgi:BirA family biotin operon repressor/biotin-[acetyl-CoA-carboxylase] ligase
LLDVDARVKWPNDVVCDRGKMAGILTESSVTTAGVAHVVLGIGINVNTAEDELPAGLPYPAASCRTLTGAPWDRADIAADVLGTIEAYYDRFLRDGFAPLRSAYEARLVHMHRDVAFEQRGVRTIGRVQGVAADGALRIDVDGDEALLYAETVEVLA